MGKHENVVVPKGMDLNVNLNGSMEEGKNGLKKHDKKKKTKRDDIIVVEPMEELRTEFEGFHTDDAKNEVAPKKHMKKGKTKEKEYKPIDVSDGIIGMSSTGLDDSKRANLERKEKEAQLEIEKKKKKRRGKCDEDTSSSNPEVSVVGLDGMNDTDKLVMDIRKKKQKRGDRSDDEVDGTSPELHVDGRRMPDASGDREKRNDKTSEPGKNFACNVNERKKKQRRCQSTDSNSREVSADGLVDARDDSAGKQESDDGVQLEKDESDASKKDKEASNTESATENDGIKDMSSSDEKRKGKKEKKGKEIDKKNFSMNEFLEKEMHVGKSSIKKSKKASEHIVNKKTPSAQKVAHIEDSSISESKKKSRRVSFSGEVKVFPPLPDTSHGENNDEGLVQGKRFTPEEDETVKEAVLKYIETNQLGDEGLHMVLKCKQFPEVKGCWKEIGASLPWRPYMAVYYRAHVLFQRSEKRQWSPEEYEILRRYHEQHGSDWKSLAEILGKHRFHVKDTWRRIKLPNKRRGQWSQDEYQALFDLVNMDLRLRAFEEKNDKHGMLRDNISWEAISQKLSTRYDAACCMKWYKQLTSPLVNEGLWADSDDYRLVDALQNVDVCCVEDVDWDNLLEHRSGEICRKRWNQMVRHIGGHREKSFIEQVEVLAKRYCPEMLEYRQ